MGTVSLVNVIECMNERMYMSIYFLYFIEYICSIIRRIYQKLTQQIEK
jgi:hypothetical protein